MATSRRRQVADAGIGMRHTSAISIRPMKKLSKSLHSLPYSLTLPEILIYELRAAPLPTLSVGNGAWLA